MNKRAYKNSNKCIKKLLWHILTICIKHYFVSYCPPNIHFPKPNPTLRSHWKQLSVKTLIILKPAKWSITRVHWLGSIWYGFSQKGILEQIRIHLFLLTECIKRVYSKHSKNAKSRSYPTYSGPREKILLGIWIWHKSKFGNQNFAWI